MERLRRGRRAVSGGARAGARVSADVRAPDFSWELDGYTTVTRTLKNLARKVLSAAQIHPRRQAMRWRNNELCEMVSAGAWRDGSGEVPHSTTRRASR